MDVEVGDIVKVVRENSVYEGVLMPTTTKNTVIKLGNGYNV